MRILPLLPMPVLLSLSPIEIGFCLRNFVKCHMQETKRVKQKEYNVCAHLAPCLGSFSCNQEVVGQIPAPRSFWACVAQGKLCVRCM